MGIPAHVAGFKPFGYHTEVAGTVIQSNIPGVNGQRIGLSELLYTAAATAHTLSLMYPGSSAGCKNSAASAAAAAQKVINVVDNPLDPAGNAAAAGDWVAYQDADGVWNFDTVAGVVAKAVTMTSNIVTAGIAAGGLVRFFGVAGDLNCFQLAATANATTEYGNGRLILVHPDRGEPMIMQSDNGTNAGFLLNALFLYLDNK